MPSDARHADVPQLIALAERIAASVQTTFGGLTAAQLNWKPQPDEWSIGQCFDHLNISTRTYFPMLEQVRAGTRQPTLAERIPILPALLGPLLIRMLDPATARPMPAPAVFQPTQSTVDSNIISTFLATQQQFIAYLHDLSGVDLRREIITSPAARFVTYSLLDACRIIVVHEELHSVQATRVLEAIPAQAADAPVAEVATAG